jgi:hypothetical protein
VPSFLSDEWVRTFNDLAAEVVVPEPGEDAALGARRGRFALRQVVTGGPDGDLVRTLRVDGDRVSMDAGDGDGPEAEVTVVLGWDDAVALSLGTFSPADAMAAGRIRVRGDLGVLAAGQAALAAVGDAIEPLRAETTY